MEIYAIWNFLTSHGLNILRQKRCWNFSLHNSVNFFFSRHRNKVILVLKLLNSRTWGLMPQLWTWHRFFSFYDIVFVLFPASWRNLCYGGAFGVWCHSCLSVRWTLNWRFYNVERVPYWHSTKKRKNLWKQN